MAGKSTKLLAIPDSSVMTTSTFATTGQQPGEETGEGQFYAVPRKPFWITRAMADHFTRKDILRATLREGLLYMIFVVAAILSTEGKKDYSMYYLTKTLETRFTGKNFLKLNDVPITFQLITTAGDFWKYMKTELLDSLYWEEYYDRKNPVREVADDDRKIFYENKLLGVPRLRQVRVKNDSCQVQKPLRKLITKCYDYYNSESEDRAAFGEKKGTAWTWSSEEVTESLTFRGYHGTYHGGGFYQDLTSTRNTSEAILEELYNNLWVTRATRCIFVDFTIYNANLNLICVCKLIFEFSPTGGIVPTAQFSTILLESGVHSLDVPSLLSEGLVYIFLLPFIMEEIIEVKYFKLAYLLSFWTYVDLTIISLLISNFLTSVVLLPDFNTAIKKISDNQNKYGNLESLAKMKDSNNVCCAILLFFSIMKIFKYLNFNKVMGQVNNTLKRCWWELSCFSYMCIIIFGAYTMAGYLLFGSTVDDFRDIGVAGFTLLRTILGDFNYEVIEEADRYAGPAFFVSFIFFVFFILLNMFLAIINDTYVDVKTEIAIATEEMGMVEFIQNGFFGLLRRCGLRIPHSATRKEANVTIKQMREAFKKCGFSDLETEMFFARFNIDPLAAVVNYDPKKILKELEELDASVGKLDDNIYVQLSDFLEQQERLDRIENSIAFLAKKLEALVGKLPEMERKSRANKG